jgi:transcription elongation factor Elf1
MRKLVVESGKEAAKLRCSECGWSYTIRRNSVVSYRVEVYEATEMFRVHGCTEFPLDEEKPIAVRRLTG